VLGAILLGRMPFLFFAAIALTGLVLWADYIAPLVAIGLYAGRCYRGRVGFG
jgi:cytochrome b subunit of formate dehydrogenase